jgi:hypothetical protein
MTAPERSHGSPAELEDEATPPPLELEDEATSPPAVLVTSPPLEATSPPELETSPPLVLEDEAGGVAVTLADELEAAAGLLRRIASRLSR